MMDQDFLPDAEPFEVDTPCAVVRSWALPGGSTPRYRQLYALIRQRLSEGELRLGDRLPEERRLARLCGVSRTTVRGALALLGAEGLIRRRTRVGTIVCGS